jgi:hypothetical protein
VRVLQRTQPAAAAAVARLATLLLGPRNSCQQHLHQHMLLTLLLLLLHNVLLLLLLYQALRWRTAAAACHHPCKAGLQQRHQLGAAGVLLCLCHSIQHMLTCPAACTYAGLISRPVDPNQAGLQDTCCAAWLQDCMTNPLLLLLLRGGLLGSCCCCCIECNRLYSIQ